MVQPLYTRIVSNKVEEEEDDGDGSVGKIEKYTNTGEANDDDDDEEGDIGGEDDKDDEESDNDDDDNQGTQTWPEGYVLNKWW